MNAETAGHAGTPQLRQFHMVNIKELLDLTSQSCNTRERALGSLPANRAFNSDQSISLSPGDGQVGRSTGPGLKLQATSIKLQASSAKLIKQQAASFKPRG